MANSSKSVVVIGGGIGGLFTAWKLCLKGMNVTVLERQKSVGGLSGSIHHDGFKIDIGPHYVILPKKSSFVNEIKGIMGSENIIEIPTIHQAYRAYFGGKILRNYPTLYETIFKNGTSSFLQSVGSYAVSRCKRFFVKNNFKSSEDYLISTYGNYLYKKWFKPYIEFTYGTTDVPLDDIVKRFPPLTLGKILKKTKKSSQRLNNNSSSDPYYYCYFKDGMGSFSYKLQEKIENCDGKIVLEAEVDSIKHDNNSKTVFYTKNNQKHEINSDIIIYATPLSVTANWFDDVPKINKTISKNMQPYHTIMIFLFVDSPRVFDGWVITVYDKHLPFFRIAQQNFLSKNVSPPGKSLISVEIKSKEDDQLWKLDESALISNVKENLENTHILRSEKIEGYKIIKLRNLYQVPLVAESKNELLNKIITSFKNEYFLGTEIDTGNVPTEKIESESSEKTLGLGGIYSALANSDILVHKIISQTN